jgi:hypothetical protein
MTTVIPKPRAHRSEMTAVIPKPRAHRSEMTAVMKNYACTASHGSG